MFVVLLCGNEKRTKHCFAQYCATTNDATNHLVIYVKTRILILTYKLDGVCIFHSAITTALNPFKVIQNISLKNQLVLMLNFINRKQQNSKAMGSVTGLIDSGLSWMLLQCRKESRCFETFSRYACLKGRLKTVIGKVIRVKI